LNRHAGFRYQSNTGAVMKAVTPWLFVLALVGIVAGIAR
jgi:hypothetical protein